MLQTLRLRRPRLSMPLLAPAARVSTRVVASVVSTLVDGGWIGTDRERLNALMRHSSRSLRDGVGGSLSLFLVLWVSSLFVGHRDGALLVASMGASAVLLFAAPSAPLSQPWNLLAGQLCSAIVGVTCARCIEQPWLSAAVAVGGAIAVMGLLGCVHPPGGATALSAVVGGPAIHQLGYEYVLTPVLLNSLLILLVALAFHGRTRNYPQRRSMKRASGTAVHDGMLVQHAARATDSSRRSASRNTDARISPPS